MTTLRRHLRHTSTIAVSLVVVQSAASIAQSGLVSPRQDFRDVTGDIWSVWTSPLRMDSHNALVAGSFVGGVALVTRFESATYAWMTTHDHSMVMRVLSPTREQAKFPAYEIGSGQYLLPIAGALYIAGHLSHSVALRDAGLGCAAGQLATLGVRSVAFHLISRARPRVTPDPFDLSVPGSSDWLRQSFFSGHMANTMACASMLSHRFKWGLAAAVPYTYASAVGIGRLADGAHWASDMVTGAIIGFNIGKAIADRQLARAGPRPVPKAASASKRPLSVPIFQYGFVF